MDNIDTITVEIEVTDTFAGELNYGWVRYYTLTMPATATDYAIMRAVKRAAEWNGMRCNVEPMGESRQLRPRNGDCLALTYSVRFNN